jgi:hypothetical protein
MTGIALIERFKYNTGIALIERVKYNNGMKGVI